MQTVRQSSLTSAVLTSGISIFSSIALGIAYLEVLSDGASHRYLVLLSWFALFAFWIGPLLEYSVARYRQGCSGYPREVVYASALILPFLVIQNIFSSLTASEALLLIIGIAGSFLTESVCLFLAAVGEQTLANLFRIIRVCFAAFGLMLYPSVESFFVSFLLTGVFATIYVYLKFGFRIGFLEKADRLTNHSSNVLILVGANLLIAASLVVEQEFYLQRDHLDYAVVSQYGRLYCASLATMLGLSLANRMKSEMSIRSNIFKVLSAGFLVSCAALAAFIILLLVKESMSIEIDSKLISAFEKSPLPLGSFLVVAPICCLNAFLLRSLAISGSASIASIAYLIGGASIISFSLSASWHDSNLIIYGYAICNILIMLGFYIVMSFYRRGYRV